MEFISILSIEFNWNFSSFFLIFLFLDGHVSVLYCITVPKCSVSAILCWFAVLNLAYKCINLELFFIFTEWGQWLKFILCLMEENKKHNKVNLKIDLCPSN